MYSIAVIYARLLLPLQFALLQSQVYVEPRSIEDGIMLLTPAFKECEPSVERISTMRIMFNGH